MRFSLDLQGTAECTFRHSTVVHGVLLCDKSTTVSSNCNWLTKDETTLRAKPLSQGTLTISEKDIQCLRWRLIKGLPLDKTRNQRMDKSEGQQHVGTCIRRSPKYIMLLIHCSMYPRS